VVREPTKVADPLLAGRPCFGLVSYAPLLAGGRRGVGGSSGRLRELFVRAGSPSVSPRARECSGEEAAVGGLLFAEETEVKPAPQALNPTCGKSRPKYYGRAKRVFQRLMPGNREVV
jgi:hypothetical protein